MHARLESISFVDEEEKQRIKTEFIAVEYMWIN